MMQDEHVKLNPGLPWQKQRSTRRYFFHQQTGLIFKEGTNKGLNSEHSFVWCRNCDISESISEIPGKF
jgi:hypothetical protein